MRWNCSNRFLIIIIHFIRCLFFTASFYLNYSILLNKISNPFSIISIIRYYFTYNIHGPLKSFLFIFNTLCMSRLRKK